MIRQWQSICDRDDIVLVVPTPNKADHWELTDLEYLHQLAERIASQYRIDPHRIVVGGQGKTGAIAWPLAFAGSDLFRHEFATSGFVNIVGGCCGTTPEHIAAIAAGVAGLPPRPNSEFGIREFRIRITQFAGLETLTIRPESNFQMIGERTNVTGSLKFARLIKAGDYADGDRGGARAGARRRQPHRHQHGRGHARLRAGDDRIS